MVPTVLIFPVSDNKLVAELYVSEANPANLPLLLNCTCVFEPAAATLLILDPSPVKYVPAI